MSAERRLFVCSLTMNVRNVHFSTRTTSDADARDGKLLTT